MTSLSPQKEDLERIIIEINSTEPETFTLKVKFFNVWNLLFLSMNLIVVIIDFINGFKQGTCTSDTLTNFKDYFIVAGFARLGLMLLAIIIILFSKQDGTIYCHYLGMMIILFLFIWTCALSDDKSIVCYDDSKTLNNIFMGNLLADGMSMFLFPVVYLISKSG